MKLEDIIMLVKAGYSKTEIDNITNSEQSGLTPVPAEEVDSGELSTAPESASEAPADPVPVPAQVTDNSAVLAALDKLTKVIQKQAIRSDDLNPVKSRTAEDILASVINPNNGKEK